MKKFLAVLMSICLITCVLSGCSNDSDSGNEMEFEQLEWPAYENAKQIPIPKSTLADVRNSNDVRFEFYLSNTTFEDYKDYVEECKAKGFTIESIEQGNRYYAFNEAKYELTVQHQEGDIMYVCVVEERFDVEIKLLHADKTSADMYNLRIEIDSYWEEDSEQGDEAITFDAYLKDGKHTLTVENDDDDDISGRVDFNVSEDGEYLEFEINCLSNKIEVTQIGGTSTDGTNTDNEESFTSTSTTVPTTSNNKVATETDIAYPVNSDMYLKLTESDIDAEFSFLRELMEFDDKHKNEALNAYLEMGDDQWNRLYIDGELFGITGQYVIIYYNAEGETYDGYINGFGFHWMIDNYETHANQMMHCLTTYFGDYEYSKEFYYDGETYNQYEWYKTTDDLWSVWLSLHDTGGWLEITPVADVVIEEEEKETYVKDGCFSITAYSFADDFEEAFDGINGHTFKTEAEVDESKSFLDVDNYVYYRILDDENYNRDVGMISFTKPNGKTLHISEEFSADCWSGINILIEEAGDVSATVVASVLAIDPGIGYSEAFDVAQDIVDNISIYTGDASELKSVECNGIKYTLYKDNKYHYLLVTALTD